MEPFIEKGMTRGRASLQILVLLSYDSRACSSTRKVVLIVIAGIKVKQVCKI